MKTVNRHLLYRLGILLAIVGAGLFFYLNILKSKDINVSTNSIYNSIESKYQPDEPQLLEDANLSPEPNQLIAFHDSNLTSWFAEKKRDETATGTRHTIYPIQEIKQSGYDPTQTIQIWLNRSQSFKAIFLYEPYFPAQWIEPQRFTIGVLLDDKAAKLKLDGSSLENNFTLTFKRGERRLLNIETENIPLGIHNLAIFVFAHIDDKRIGSHIQYDMGANFSTSGVFKVYVGDNALSPNIQFVDWSTGSNPTSNLDNSFMLNNIPEGIIKDGSSYGSPLWEHRDFEAGEKVTYTLSILNSKPYDREYCMIAYFDYKPFPIEGDSLRICGIVRGGQIGLVKGSFVVLSDTNTHHFQVILNENPMMKKSLAQIKRNEGQELSPYTSSGRILIQAKPK